MRRWLIGCGAVLLVGFIVCAGGLIWLFRPPRIEIPTRDYPPNNAYAEYRRIAEQMWATLDTDTRFKQAEDALLRDKPISEAERVYYLTRIEPYLKAYAPLTQLPSKAVYAYDINERFPEYAQMRRIARAEHYFIREALRRKRYPEALERMERVNRLAEQIRTGSATFGYLVGVSLNTIALAPLREELPRINDTETLERLIQIVRDYETRRTPFYKALEEERYAILAIFADIDQGKRTLSELSPAMADTPERRAVTRILVNLSLPEFHRMVERQIQEARKPFHERDSSVFREEPKQLLNAILYPVSIHHLVSREAAEAATFRLIGCTAAIRLHRQRTGQYPPTLEALRLGEMAIDPFSGKPFCYQVDAQRGFLLYSVSENGVDDGGFVPYGGGTEPRGDLSAVFVRIPESLIDQKRDQRPLAPPQWIR